MLPQNTELKTENKLLDIPSKTYKLQITGQDKETLIQQVEYLESTGTQLIQIPNYNLADIKFVIKCQFLDTNTICSAEAIGTRQTRPMFFKRYYYEVLSIYRNIDWVSASNNTEVSLDTITTNVGQKAGSNTVGNLITKTSMTPNQSFPDVVIITATTNSTTVTDASGAQLEVVTRTYPAESELSGGTIENRYTKITLFGANWSSNEADTYQPAKVRIYDVQILNKQTNGVISHYIPVLDRNKVPCLYEINTKYFYYDTNKAEPFKVGNFVSYINEGENFLRITDGTYFPDGINGYVDNIEAIKQSVYHILSIERYAYPIYSTNYGVELEQYIGKDFGYLESSIESTLKDALTYDLRIKDIKVTDIEKDGDTALVKFIVYSIYGDLQLEVNIVV